MNVSGRRQTQAAGELRAQIADDVAEKIAGDDDVELAWVADDLHRQRVDIQVARIDVRVFLADFLEDPLPEVVRKSHSVGLVAHADALVAVQASVFESVADNALDAFAGVHVLLNGDFVRRAFLEEPANSDVETLGVLAKDHQANVFFGPVAQRSEPVVEEFHWASVDVEIELEAQPQQNIGGMLIRWNAGIAQCPEENGVKLVAQHLDGARRQRNAFAQILVRAPIKLGKFQGPPGGRGHGFQHLDRLRSNLRPDAVAGYHRDSGRGSAVSQRNAGQSLASSTAGLAPSTDLRGLKRPGAILPPKWSTRQLYQVLRQTAQARRSLRTVSLSMRSKRGSNPMPGPLGTRKVPCGVTVTSGWMMSSAQ